MTKLDHPGRALAEELVARGGAEWSAIVVCRGDDRYTKRVGAGETPAEARAIVEDAVMALGRAKCDAAE